MNKSHSRLLLFLLECNVEQMLHKNLFLHILDFFFLFIYFFLFAGRLCVPQLTFRTFSVYYKRKTNKDNFRLLTCHLFLICLILLSDSPLLQHQKRCVLLYISSGLLSLSVCMFVFFPTGEILLYLTGWFYFFFSDCFLEIKFYGIIRVCDL